MLKSVLHEIRVLNKAQRSAFVACFLGWSLDAFDFFILNYCLTAIAADFHVSLEQAAEAIFWTLVMRPVGAVVFGLMAERFGRRPTLMVNVVAFSAFELASAFAPTLPVLLVCRALFGIAMGGEWGIGSALALETLPKGGRGFFSGLLQEGYAVGNMAAGLMFMGLFPHLHGVGMLTNWRVMFMVGALPALLVFYIRMHVPESPAWVNARAKGHVHTTGLLPKGTVRELLRHWGRFLTLMLMMMAFMTFSHGTQDLYPTLLAHDHHLSTRWVGLMGFIAGGGAVMGGMCWGAWSEWMGRRAAIICSSLLTIPLIPLWAWTHSLWLVGAGAFLMQFMVQGAWGIVPAHLNEISPAAVRVVLPGLVYQMGSLLSSRNGVLQAHVAAKFSHGNLSPVMAGTVVVAALFVATTTHFGGEAKGVDLSRADEPEAVAG